MLKLLLFNNSFPDLENKVIETIQAGDVDDISTITPKHLTECKTNALFMAMKVRHSSIPSIPDIFLLYTFFNIMQGNDTNVTRIYCTVFYIPEKCSLYIPEHFF